MGCKECGKPKCNGKCGCKSPKVLQINNPAEYITFHKVSIPAAMGDSTTNPPRIGAYRNALVYYEADHTSWMYSTDGIPTLVTGKQGPTGPQGPAGTITIGATTTGATGEDAFVENVGTPENAILNFTIPRGEQGEQGEPGPQGYMNEQDVRDVVNTIIPEDFFDDSAIVSDCGVNFELEDLVGGEPVSVELSGNSFQQTYSGKNLMDLSGTLTNQYLDANGVYQTGQNVEYINKEFVGLPSTNYTFSCSGRTGNAYVRFCQYTSGGVFINRTLLSANTTITTDASCALIKTSTNNWPSAYFDDPQIEKGSTATDYEPYTGGIPSPSTSYPQSIQTATGEQTIDVNGNSYIVNLGAIELCKISDCEDRIYKNEDGWHLYKAIGKKVLGNQDAVGRGGTNTSGRYRWYIACGDNKIVSDNNTQIIALCTVAPAGTRNTTYARTDSIAGTTDSRFVIYLDATSQLADITQMNAWLGANTPTVYYALETPSDTLITDAVLIAQLEEISLENGNNSISISAASSLPCSLCLGGYSDNWNGTISSIRKDIGAITEKVDEVKYIFPKNWYGMSGDANLIKAYGKTILIDTYRASNKSDLYQMFSDFGIDHIDYLILTHYHDDHVGNAVNLIDDGYVDVDSYIYLPPDCQQIEDDPTLSNFKNTIASAISSNNIPSGIPEEWSKLEIDKNFSIQFYNTDYDALSSFTNYNNCSTLCLIRHGDTKSYWTGDALGSAQGRALDDGFIDGHVDLYKVEHHGIQADNTTIKIQRTILPTYAYQPAFVRDLDRGIYDRSTALSYLAQNGSKIYASYLNEDYIVFGSTVSNMWVEQGKQSANVSNNNAVGDTVYVIYVDAANTSHYQDGMTWDTAYNDIGRAIAHAEKSGVGKVGIALREGEYGLTLKDSDNNVLASLANGVNLYIYKAGTAAIENTKIKGKFSFVKCDVEFSNVTFENDATVGTNITAIQSSIYVHNCVLDGSSATTPTFIWCNRSDVAITSNTISNYEIIVSGHIQDAINIADNTIEDVTTVSWCRGGIARSYGNTMTNVTNRVLSSNGGYDLDCNGKTIYSGNATSGTLTLSDDLHSYNKIVVVSGTVAGGTLSTDIVYSYYPSNTFNYSATYPIRTLDGKYAATISADGKSLDIVADGTSLPIRTITAFKVPNYS